MNVESGSDKGRRIDRELAPRLFALIRRQRAPPADLLPTSPRRSDASTGAFADQRALKLGERSHHVEHQYAARRVGVDAFGQ